MDFDLLNDVLFADSQRVFSFSVVTTAAFVGSLAFETDYLKR